MSERIQQAVFDITRGEEVAVMAPLVLRDRFGWLPVHDVPRFPQDGVSTSHRFREHVEGNGDRRPPFLDPGEADAPWVLGRLMRVFNLDLQPEDQRMEKSLFSFAMLGVVEAVSGNVQPAWFYVADYYLTSGLIVTEGEPEAVDQIAGAFWELLLEDPDGVPDYSTAFHHIGGDFSARLGIENGRAYYREFDN